MDAFPCRGILLFEILMIGSMDIVIMLGSDDGCLSTIIILIGIKSKSC